MAVQRLSLVALSVSEIRKLLLKLVWRFLPSPESVWHWSTWRRRHQARAKASHYRRRGMRLA